MSISGKESGDHAGATPPPPPATCLKHRLDPILVHL